MEEELSFWWSKEISRKKTTTQEGKRSEGELMLRTFNIKTNCAATAVVLTGSSPCVQVYVLAITNRQQKQYSGLADKRM